MAGTEKQETEDSKTMSKSNSLGIPQAVFVEDVDSFMQQTENETVEVVLKRLDEQHQKYRYMELNLTTKKRRLKQQLPDITNTLEAVRHLRDNRDQTLDTQFLLSDQLYVKAKVPPTERVSLWLGANIMLEYSLDEADTLLSKNMSQAKAALDQVENDLGYLRDQTTTVEVSMARVYNWDVKRRQQAKLAAA